MYVLLIIALACIAAIGWFWHKKPVVKVKGSPARTWPAARGKNLAKRKFVVPF